jgi:hypothetical protein
LDIDEDDENSEDEVSTSSWDWSVRAHVLLTIVKDALAPLAIATVAGALA